MPGHSRQLRSKALTADDAESRPPFCFRWLDLIVLLLVIAIFRDWFAAQAEPLAAYAVHLAGDPFNWLEPVARPASFTPGPEGIDV
jgi:hypothetical protein